LTDYTTQTTPPTIKFALVKGDTLLQTLRVKKTGFDFTGTTVRSQIKRSRNNTNAIATLTPALTFPSLGIMTVTLRIEYPDTNWQPATYYADVELTFPDGVRKTVAFLEIEAVQDAS
jgi:hypothetical protein